MLTLNKIYSSLIFISVILFSCDDNRLDVDLSNIPKHEVNVLRLDQDFFQMDTTAFSKSQQINFTKYGSFYFNYLNNIVNLASGEDSLRFIIKKFITDPDIRASYNDVQKKFTSTKMTEIEQELSESFRYFVYHFPKSQKPKRVVSFISGFNYNITPQDSVLGFGLDMYLGEKSKFYELLQWPKYKVHQMSEEYIVADCMKGWIMFSFEENQPINNLLSYMIRMGKIYYALDAVLPETPDSIKIGYTSFQMKYCNQFEKNIWAFFTQKDRLFKTDMKELADYSSEGPFTAAISKDCPPRIASWVGWQLVRSYMNKNENITLEQLMKEKDINKILNQSKYKP